MHRGFKGRTAGCWRARAHGSVVIGAGKRNGAPPGNHSRDRGAVHSLPVARRVPQVAAAGGRTALPLSAGGQLASALSSAGLSPASAKKNSPTGR